MTKNQKTVWTLLFLLGLAAAMLVLLPGCKTTPDSKPIPLDPQRTSQAIRVIITAAVPFAVQKDSNCVPYLRMVQQTLTLACDNNVYDPDLLAEQLKLSSAKELKTPEAQAATQAIVAIYRIYYGDVVSAKLNQTDWMKPVLKGIIGGLQDSLPKP